ncbi:alpha/beta fold hydrolase [Ottowia thiooxydans]|uniref:alpha/beta fold hydrolase n=1 Tax=Ottowia thiooxydans TaxID=219182 RepID=UPI000407EC81|nr:alpha/beta fold hydrolase [Ottowia thiooxydans]
MKLSRSVSIFGAALAGALLIFGLSACGGDDTPDPLQKYREQSVQWTECDPTILGVRSEKLDDLWASAGERLRCGFVRAPLDWSTPERGDVVIAVMRLAAGTPEKRRGSLVFNPGGPGADGLSITFALFSAFAKSNPDNPQGASQLRLLNEYDMVGFSPRGTGASTQLHCGTNELKRFVNSSVTEWDTPENIANVNYNGSKIAQACLKNPITPYINTDATVRDMDLLRGLLGDEKLNYVGYSYGTWLGSWYASVFPEKVGRMVLDSSLDFNSTLEQGIFGGQPPARQRLLDEVMIPYAVRHPDYFHLGTSEADLRALISQMSPYVQDVLAGPLSNLGYSRTDADSYVSTIAAAQGLDAVLKTTPDPSDMEAIGSALDQYVFDPVSEERNAVIRNSAKNLRLAYFQRWIQRATWSISLSPSEAVLFAVHCNDTVSTTDLTAWADLLRGWAQKSPLFFSSMMDYHACSFWGGPKVSKPALTPMKSLDVLLVQSQYDAATNTDGANTFFEQLPAARRVYVPGDFQHGVYPYTDSCVDPLVTSYLLGDSPTQREAVCAGHPFTQDALVPNTNTKAASAPESPASVPPVYKDPERARELIEEFKRGLIPPQYGH